MKCFVLCHILFAFRLAVFFSNMYENQRPKALPCSLK
uniref:Uncharacterized protein n=1 Tax=Arundo donax TaxID=35708 RepID=A0A0A8YUH2_ARUDO